VEDAQEKLWLWREDATASLPLIRRTFLFVHSHTWHFQSFGAHSSSSWAVPVLTSTGQAAGGSGAHLNWAARQTLTNSRYLWTPLSTAYEN
jgi:hypothetical protein